MTTIHNSSVQPRLGVSAASTTGISARQFVPWIVLAAIVVLAIGVLLTIRIVQPGSDAAPRSAANAQLDTTVHGTSGNLFTSSGAQVGVSMPHTGPGNAMSVSRQRQQ